jgi:hypothetical protein
MITGWGRKLAVMARYNIWAEGVAVEGMTPCLSLSAAMP